MQKTYFFVGIICLITAVLIFIFADGFRRIYSGLFFILLGLVLIRNSKYFPRS